MDRELEKLKSARSELDAVIADKERAKRSKSYGITITRPIWKGYGRKVGRTITRWDAHGRRIEEVIK